MLAVVKRPVVAILATGDELVEPSDRPGRRPNRFVECLRHWQRLSKRPAAPPSCSALRRIMPKIWPIKIKDAEGADILVTTGGASVGDHDLVRPALEAAGATLQFYKIAMRPGKPTFFGTRATTTWHAAHRWSARQSDRVDDRRARVSCAADCRPARTRNCRSHQRRR